MVQEGAFLVRRRTNVTDSSPFCISVVSQQCYFQLLIRRRPDGLYACGYEKANEKVGLLCWSDISSLNFRVTRKLRMFLTSFSITYVKPLHNKMALSHNVFRTNSYLYLKSRNLTSQKVQGMYARSQCGEMAL